MAIASRVRVFKITWPWGQSKEDEEAEQLANKPADPEQAARELVAFVKRKQAGVNRKRKKK